MGAVAKLWGAPWPDVVTAVAAVLAALGVIFAAFQFVDSRRTRAAEIARQLAQQWESEELVASRKLVYRCDAAGTLTYKLNLANKTGSDEFYVFERYLNFFEQIGIQFNSQPLGFKIVNELLGGSIIQSWDTMKPAIDAVWGDTPTVAANFRKLAANLKLYRERQARRQPKWYGILRPFRATA